MKKRLMAGLLVFTMIISSAMPVMAAPRARKIYIEGKRTVTVGSTIKLDSEIRPDEAEVRDRNIIWTSSKPSVAKVLKKRDDDNPTIGIVLCEETDEDIARYSILHGNEQLFASKYKLYLPDEDELRREISRQKAIFQLQQKEKAALKEADADE